MMLDLVIKLFFFGSDTCFNVGYVVRTKDENIDFDGYIGN